MPRPPAKLPKLLAHILATRSPSGTEGELLALLDRTLEPVAQGYARDPIGNRIATLNPDGKPHLALFAHTDEIGLLVRYIDERGFVFVDKLGNHDTLLVPGRQVEICGRFGWIPAIVGRRPIHLLEPAERERLPSISDLWLDLGVDSRASAEKLVRIGDPVVYARGLAHLQGELLAAPGLDNKAGVYCVAQAFLELAQSTKLRARVDAVFTAQEEVGCRGAAIAARVLQPAYGIIVDVGFGTDHPDCDHRRHGDYALGHGAILTRGPNLSEEFFARVEKTCQRAHVPIQIEGDPRPTSTDAREVQLAGQGVHCALASIPLRYMHSPNELIALSDLIATTKLLTATALDLGAPAKKVTQRG